MDAKLNTKNSNTAALSTAALNTTIPNSVTLNSLQLKYKSNKKRFNDDFSLRMYRGLSWQAKAEDLVLAQEYDLAFITQWVGFNALYAKELPLNQSRNVSDRFSFKEFIHNICQLDDSERLYDLIWNRYPQSIRTLLNNRYTFAPFWLYHNGTHGNYSEQDWQTAFAKDKHKALRYLSHKDNVDKLLIVIFERLYTLRNQIVHGGATYASSVNREQVKDAVQILGNFVPLITDIMLNHPQQNWGKPFYPPVDDASFD